MGICGQKRPGRSTGLEFSTGPISLGFEKFKAEDQTLAALSLKHDASPYIVKVFRLFEARGTAYILQEFVDVPLLPHVSGATTPKDIENLFFQL